MNILLTGGAGLVGRPVARWLVERGFTVRVIDRAANCDIPGGAMRSVISPITSGCAS